MNESHGARALLRATLLTIALLLSAACMAASRIGVVTMQPGEEYWARFGHDAILVDDRQDDPASEPLLYNFGYFDFDQPGFFLHFAQGYMNYQLAAVPAQEDLAGYAHDGRGVTLQWLDMTPAQATKLQHFLQWNALPEHATYRYDYFTQDCTTRVRDALDFALDGRLRAQMTTPSHGLTYRSEAIRLGAPDWWLGLSMHFALGPFADRPLSLWDEAFIPSRLQDSLRTLHTAAGTPLVLKEIVLLPQRLPPALNDVPRWRPWFVSIGLALAVLFLVGMRFAPRTTAAFAGLFLAEVRAAGAGAGDAVGLHRTRRDLGQREHPAHQPAVLRVVAGSLGDAAWARTATLARHDAAARRAICRLRVLPEILPVAHPGQRRRWIALLFTDPSGAGVRWAPDALNACDRTCFIGQTCLIDRPASLERPDRSTHWCRHEPRRFAHGHPDQYRADGGELRGLRCRRAAPAGHQP